MTAFGRVTLGKFFFLVFCSCGFMSESSGFSLFLIFFLLKEIKKISRLYVLIVHILLLEHSREVIPTSLVYFVK